MEDTKEPTKSQGQGTDEPAEASLEEMLAKRPEEAATADEDSDEEPIIPPAGGGDRVETLSVKVVPQQPTEFVCANCHLVKHRSQLKDKKRTLCRDCA